MTRARYATIRFPLGMSLVAIGLLIGVDGALVQTAAALGFALCGLALAFDSERSKVPISILGAAVALLGLVNAAAAPEFAIAFFTAGLVISFKNRASGSASLLALQLFWLVIFVVACGIFLGHLLNAILNIPLFEQVLGRYEVNRMGSAGLIVLCMMLFYSLRQTPAMVAFYEGRQDRQIAAQSIVLLVSLGLVAGMGGAGILAKEIMAGFEATLSDALEANARHFRESVASATGEADRIAELSDLQGDAGTLQARLQKILELQKAEGVRAIWVSDAREGCSLLPESALSASRTGPSWRLANLPGCSGRRGCAWSPMRRSTGKGEKSARSGSKPICAISIPNSIWRKASGNPVKSWSARRTKA